MRVRAHDPGAAPFAAKNGVVIATEKKAPTILIDETSLQKICMLTDSIGAVYSGMGARTGARHAPRAR